MLTSLWSGVRRIGHAVAVASHRRPPRPRRSRLALPVGPVGSPRRPRGGDVRAAQRAPDDPGPTDKPQPTAPRACPSAISFSALKFDAADDPAGENRVITFDASAPGTVSAVLSSMSPQGETKMCLSSTKKDFGCTTTASGSISAPTRRQAADLVPPDPARCRDRGARVDVALTFPDADPS